MLLIFRPKIQKHVPSKEEVKQFEDLCSSLGIDLKSGLLNTNNQNNESQSIINDDQIINRPS